MTKGTERETPGVVGATTAVKGGKLVVMGTTKDSPARRAGLMRGDHIVAIEDEPTDHLTRQQAGERIRGPVGSQVVLQVERPGGGRLSFALIRQPAPGSAPLPPGTVKLLLGVAAGLIGITTVVWLLSAWREDHIDAAAEYARLLREGNTQEAYGRLASRWQGAMPYEQWLHTMNTPLLLEATAFDVGSSRKTSSGRGCVRASIEARGRRVHLTVYTLAEGTRVGIYSVVTNEEESRAAWSQVRPWEC